MKTCGVIAKICECKIKINIFSDKGISRTRIRDINYPLNKCEPLVWLQTLVRIRDGPGHQERRSSQEIRDTNSSGRRMRKCVVITKMCKRTIKIKTSNNQQLTSGQLVYQSMDSQKKHRCLLFSYDNESVQCSHKGSFQAPGFKDSCIRIVLLRTRAT